MKKTCIEERKKLRRNDMQKTARVLGVSQHVSEAARLFKKTFSSGHTRSHLSDFLHI